MLHVDYHCHILPGLDDGAKTLEEGIVLAGALARWGFTTAVCTPHIVTKFRNNPQTISAAYDILSREIERRNIPLDICWSAEYRLVPETWPECIRENWLKPFEGDKLLIELPISHPMEMGEINPVEEIRRLRDMGYVPILAHPERYAYLSDENLLEMQEAGVLYQIDYTSLAGVYDKASEERARDLVAKGFDSRFYGTDLHNQYYVTKLDAYFSENPLK